MSCGVVWRRGSDPVLLWPWNRPAATAPIRPLAWDPPYATGAALEKANQKKEKKWTYLQLPKLYMYNSKFIPRNTFPKATEIWVGRIY